MCSLAEILGRHTVMVKQCDGSAVRNKTNRPSRFYWACAKWSKRGSRPAAETCLFSTRKFSFSVGHREYLPRRACGDHLGEEGCPRTNQRYRETVDFCKA